jgi:16S rRNA (cytosine967-C5)-methyltransferase
MDLPRETALRILTDIEDRQVQLELTLDRLEGGPLDERDRRFIRQLVYGCLTWRSRLDWIAQAFSKRPINRIDAVAQFLRQFHG